MGRSALTRSRHRPEPVPKRPGKALALARFELRGAEGARPSRRHRHAHRSGRGRPRIVAPLDAHLDRLRPRVDEPEPARLRHRPSGVEPHHPVPRLARGHHVVHRSEEAVGGAHVAQHPKVERARKRQAPVPLAGAEVPREPLRAIAPLKVRRAQVHRLARPQPHRHRAVAHARIVEPLDAHRPARIGAVDEAHHPLGLRRTRSRDEQRDAVPGAWRRARHRAPPRRRGRARALHIEGDSVRRRCGVGGGGVHRVGHPRVGHRTRDASPLLGVQALELRRAALQRPDLHAHRALGAHDPRGRAERRRREQCARHSPAVTVDHGHGAFPAGPGAR